MIGVPMLAILFAHAVATALAPLLVYRWGRMAFYPAVPGPARLAGLGGAELAWTRAGPRRQRDVGTRAVDEHHPSVRRARGDHERAGAGDRRAGALLLR